MDVRYLGDLRRIGYTQTPLPLYPTPVENDCQSFGPVRNMKISNMWGSSEAIAHKLDAGHTEEIFCPLAYLVIDRVLSSWICKITGLTHNDSNRSKNDKYGRVPSSTVEYNAGTTHKIRYPECQLRASQIFTTSPQSPGLWGGHHKGGAATVISRFVSEPHDVKSVNTYDTLVCTRAHVVIILIHYLSDLR